jgi:hypothetical protein
MPSELVSVHAVTVSADGRQLLVADARQLHSFDIATGSSVRPSIDLAHSQAEPALLRASPDGRLVAVARSDGAIDVIGLDARVGVERTLEGVGTDVLDVEFIESRTLAAVGRDEVALWDLDQPSTLTRQRFDLPSLSSEFFPGGRALAVAAEDGSIHRIGVRTGAVQQKVAVHPPAMPGLRLGATDVVLDPRGRWVASISDTDAKLAVTGQRTGRPLFPAVTVGSPPLVPALDLALAPDARAVAATNGVGEVVLVDLETGRERWRVDTRLRSFYRHPVVFVGDLVFTGSSRGIAAFDATDGRRRRFFRRPGVVTALAARREDGTVAAAFNDGVVELLDVRTGRTRTTFDHSEGVTNGLAFVPRQHMLAASTTSGTVVLFDLRAARRYDATLPPVQPDTGVVGAAHVSTNSRESSIAVSYHPGGVAVWALDPAGWRRRACEIAGRDLLPIEREEHLPNGGNRPTCPSHRAHG